MSVIKKSIQEMDKLEAEVQYLAKYGEPAQPWKFVRHAVQYSTIYALKFTQHCRLRAEKPNEDELIQGIIGRLCWYLWIGNKTAHALQYQEEPGFFEDDPTQYKWTDTRPPESIKQLLQDLKSLDYNLITNDGHYFVSQPWYDLFNDIIHAVEMARNEQLEPKETPDRAFTQ